MPCAAREPAARMCHREVVWILVMAEPVGTESKSDAGDSPEGGVERASRLAALERELHHLAGTASGEELAAKVSDLLKRSADDRTLIERIAGALAGPLLAGRLAEAERRRIAL